MDFKIIFQFPMAIIYLPKSKCVRNTGERIICYFKGLHDHAKKLQGNQLY